jgi:hypothetical protein
MTLIIGIDPGLDGACAFLPGHSLPWVWTVPTVEETLSGGKKRRHLDAATLATELRGIGDRLRPCMAYIERVASSPQQGVCSAFSMGEGLGIWLGVLGALGIPHVRIAPTAWKRRVGLPSGATKEDSRAAALRLFPALAADLKRKCDHGRAEALLIAWVGAKCGQTREEGL